jgi:hypothetical protein
MYSGNHAVLRFITTYLAWIGAIYISLTAIGLVMVPKYLAQATWTYLMMNLLYVLIRWSMTPDEPDEVEHEDRQRGERGEPPQPQ